MRKWPAVVALVLATAPVEAHVVVSPTLNNRYVKVTPAADRVRLAYTIVIGETPGRTARQALDKDGNGELTDDEIAPWKADVAERVRAGMEVHLDKAKLEVAWSEVVVGLGTPEVAAGSFSIDLIAWFCAPRGGARHELDLVDRFVLAPPGETEVKVESQPGVTIDVARVGPEGGGGDLIQHERKFEGSAAPLAQGLRLVYNAAGAPLSDGKCPQRERPAEPMPRWPFAVGAVAALVAAVALRMRRKKALLRS